MTDPSDLELILAARGADLPGGLHVLRALPQAQRRMVGPFVFLDQMGPAQLAAGHGLEVGPHPHIGLSTVTYLFEGEAIHRDTLGTVQRIRPGDVNWMTAGRGIAHSERAPPELLATGGPLFGIQIWVALPKAHEETAPAFAHYPAAQLPAFDDGGVALRLVAGALEGLTSPVKTHSELFYAVASLEEGAVVRLTAAHAERAAFVVQGTVSSGKGELKAGELGVFSRGPEVLLRACAPSRVLIFGGAPLEAPRHIWWNFVSSSKERIEQAKDDWRAQRFGPIPDETTFIPLP